MVLPLQISGGLKGCLSTTPTVWRVGEEWSTPLGPASLLDTLSLRSQSAGVGAHPPEAPQGRAGCASVQGGPGYVFQLHYVT